MAQLIDGKKISQEIKDELKEKVKELNAGVGFDVISEKYVDMMAEGIIDPVKVTKNALINAVSISATFLTTEAAVADIKEAAPAVPAGNPDMGY